MTSSDGAGKVVPLAEAIARDVPDGSSVVMGTALEALIPFAAGHEIIRQGTRDLTLIGPISDILFDQLIGAGVVNRLRVAWVGNVSEGLGHNYRRARERALPHPLEVEPYSNLTVSLGLLAAALGAPYIPTYSLLGTDILRENPSLRAGIGPFGEPIVRVPAIRPDVAILHVQRADAGGGAHAWGNLGVTREAFLAARRVILTTEEIVPSDVIRSDPNRVLGPPHKVSAVVHVPGGAHPSPVQGYYNRDHAFFRDYHQETRSAEGWRRWLEEWVLSVPGRDAYLEKLGAERWEALRPKKSLCAAPVDYGY
ncbi:MAG TPA: CoA-transferase [Chloroflexota bacterium]|nr:CoA-transferase [Chloroflexota bacterium]